MNYIIECFAFSDRSYHSYFYLNLYSMINEWQGAVFCFLLILGWPSLPSEGLAYEHRLAILRLLAVVAPGLEDQQDRSDQPRAA